MKCFYSIVLAVSTFLTTFQAYSATILYFNSEPGDFVGQGMERILSDDTLFDITALRNFDNGVSFMFDSFDRAGFFDGERWQLRLAAPFGTELTVGVYENATRFPFQDPDVPGLDFSGDGRGSNMLTGEFEVLEAVYGSSGEVLSFAVNFEQHSEGRTPALFGEMRFNSDIGLSIDPHPIPETGSTLILLCFSFFGLRWMKKTV